MNRTNSVEPVFTQPLQTTYHQLLQNKTKIEDELYQTQRQLRRKEGEYLKKIAIYEQKIDQMQEQIDEFREREEQTKAMYEKILNALEGFDNNSYSVDNERLQELLIQICKSQQGSPKAIDTNLNASFNKRQSMQQNEQMKQQIESLEQSVQQLNDSLQKSKTQLSLKEKENSQLTSQIEELNHKIELMTQEHTTAQQNLKQEHQSQLVKKEQLMKQHSQTLEQELSKNFELQKTSLQQKIQNLESKIDELQKQNQELTKENQQARIQVSVVKSINKQQEIEKLLIKENQDFKQTIEKQKKEQEQVIKEKEQLKEQLNAQEQAMKQAKKQNNINITNNNENIKRLKSKIQDLEKELTQKNEEIQKLQQKTQQSKPVEKKVSALNTSGGQLQSSTSQLKPQNGGQKELHITVDISGNDNKVVATSTLINKKATGPLTKNTNRSSGKSKKMFGQPIHLSINNQNEPQTHQIQTPAMSRLKQDPRSSYGNQDTSMINMLTTPHTQQDLDSLNESPSSRQKIKLEKTLSQQVSTHQNLDKHNHKRQSHNNLDDSQNIMMNTKNSGGLLKYITACNRSDAEDDLNNTGDLRLNSSQQQTFQHQPTYILHQKEQPKYTKVSPRIKNTTSTERSQERSQHTSRFNHQRSDSKYLNEGDKALLTSIEIEQVVRRMLDQVYNEKSVLFGLNDQSVLMPSQYHNIQTSSQNVSFSGKRQSANDDLKSSTYQHNYGIQQNTGRQNENKTKNLFSVDREFLTKLEFSLKKLTKQNEKIKQIMREKEECEKVIIRLKQKVKMLKEDKNNLLIDRENIIQQNHKMECKLKQAQVILNLEGDFNQNNTTTSVFDRSHNSSQKNLIKHFRNRDVSPGAHSNSTAQDERFRNAPMSCRVNDSYDISLRLNQENFIGSQHKNMLNTHDRSLLDQSLLTMKKELSQQPQFNQQQQYMGGHISQFSLNSTQNQSQFFNTKFMPNNRHGQSAIHQNTARGKTPTLQINLASNQDQIYILDATITQSNNNSQAYFGQKRDSNHALCISTEGEEPNSTNHLISSRNFNRSAANLISKKTFQNKLNVNAANNNQLQSSYRHQSQTQRQQQLFKYQSNRDGSLSNLKSPPQMHRMSSNSSGGLGGLQKSQHINYSSIGLGEQINITRDKSPQPYIHIQSNNLIQASQICNQNLLKRINSNSSKAQDRYYSRRAGANTQSNQTRYNNNLLSSQHNHSQNSYKIQKMNKIQAYTFDEDEEIDQLEEQRFTVNEEMFEESHDVITNEQFEDDDDTINNTEETLTPNDPRLESSHNIKIPPLPSKRQHSEQSQSSQDQAQHQIMQQQMTWKQKRKIAGKCNRDDVGVPLPSDEREDEEESVQYKLLNNSNIIGASMHSRYVSNEDSQ